MKEQKKVRWLFKKAGLVVHRCVCNDERFGVWEGSPTKNTNIKCGRCGVYGVGDDLLEAIKDFNNKIDTIRKSSITKTITLQGIDTDVERFIIETLDNWAHGCPERVYKVVGVDDVLSKEQALRFLDDINDTIIENKTDFGFMESIGASANNLAIEAENILYKMEADADIKKIETDIEMQRQQAFRKCCENRE